MTKTILITGATDGIGLATAKMLAEAGHRVLIHGRSAEKLRAAADELGGDVACYRADLSDLAQVDALAAEVAAQHSHLDVLINNAGVFKSPHPAAPNGMDLRFVVNTLAPIRLTRALASRLDRRSRVISLSSAGQAPVDVAALAAGPLADAYAAYAQSKLALTLWSQEAAQAEGAPVMIAVNPGSLLASKMVKEAFGQSRSEVTIGAEILCKAALDPEFADASGRYFDNDSGRFAPPQAQADKAAQIVAEIDALFR